MRSWILLLSLTASLRADDWPQWMGPQRDGVWREPGVRREFPATGLKPLWKAEIASGYSGPAVANGAVFLMDYLRQEGNPKPDPGTRNGLKGHERVHCFDSHTGEKRWTHSYICDYHVSYPAGPRCTPTVDGNRVYTLGTMGHLCCLDRDSGKVIWQHDFTQLTVSKVPIWGYAGHPLVYKDLLICLAGGRDSLVVALNKHDGKIVWKALSTPDDGPGYCPPSLIEAGGVTQLVLWHPQAMVSLNPETGKLYWEHPIAPNYGMSIMMPRKAGNLLYAGGIGHAAVAMKLSSDEPKAKLAWTGQKHNALYPANSTPLIEGDTLYGVDVHGVLRAMRLSTGERLWDTTQPVVNHKNKPVPHGTVFLTRHEAGDEKGWYLFNEKGDLISADLTPGGWKILSQTHLIDPTTPAFDRTVVWSHPAYAEKTIYVRNDRELLAYSLK